MPARQHAYKGEISEDWPVTDATPPGNAHAENWLIGYLSGDEIESWKTLFTELVPQRALAGAHKSLGKAFFLLAHL